MSAFDHQSFSSPTVAVVASQSESIGGVDQVILFEPSEPFDYSRGALLFKRRFDRVAALVALMLTAPIQAAIALAVRLTSRGPILFRQERIGRHGVPFTILKFRTMRADAETILATDPATLSEYLEHGYKIPLEGDTRITPIGRFLRRSSLDELPQLINVLRGEMSIVGPRPVLHEELGLYGEYVDSYLKMHPGLTGKWQVGGRDLVGYPDRAILDAEYVKNWSLRQDFAILLRTVRAVFGQHGVK